MNNIKKLISKPLFLPIFCMLLVMAVNIIYDVASGNFAFNFFTISIRNGVLYGRMIDILNRGSEIAILAIGMTLVVSCSAGTDISVGSVMSLAASFCCMLLAGYGVSSTNELARPLIIGVLGGILIGCVCGAFNGFLVSYLNVQPTPELSFRPALDDFLVQMSGFIDTFSDADGFKTSNFMIRLGIAF